jgi:outer membrane protein, heavy metal efflux system
MVEPLAAAPMRLAGAVALLLGIAGCYHAQPVSDADLVAELRGPPWAVPGAEDAPAAAAARPAEEPASAPTAAVARRGAAPGAPAPAPGATPSSPAPRAAASAGPVVTEEQAVAAALVRNPDLRAFRRKRQVAEGQVLMAKAIENPSLKLEAVHLETWGDVGPGVGVGLQWKPPQPAVRSAKVRLAEAHVQEVQQEILEHEWQLAAKVRAACAAVVELEEQRRILAEAIARRQRIVDLVGKRLQAGASTRLDLSLANLALAQLERDHEEIEAQRLVAVDALAALLGTAEVTVAPPPSPASVALAAPPDAHALEEQALGARPALRAAKARYQAREQAVRREYAERWPWFRLDSAPRYRYMPSSSHYRNDFYFAVEVTVPIFNWNTGGIKVAEAQRAEERDRMIALLSEIRRDIVSARARLEVQRVALQRFRDRVLPALAEHQRLLQLAIRGGQVDLVALTASEDVVVKHQRAHAMLQLQYRRAWLALERAVGAPVGAGR